MKHLENFTCFMLRDMLRDNFVINTPEKAVFYVTFVR